MIRRVYDKKVNILSKKLLPIHKEFLEKTSSEIEKRFKYKV
jgi:hypothetical protein